MRWWKCLLKTSTIKEIDWFFIMSGCIRDKQKQDRKSYNHHSHLNSCHNFNRDRYIHHLNKDRYNHRSNPYIHHKLNSHNQWDDKQNKKTNRQIKFIMLYFYNMDSNVIHHFHPEKKKSELLFHIVHTFYCVFLTNLFLMKLQFQRHSPSEKLWTCTFFSVIYIFDTSILNEWSISFNVIP